MLCVFDVNETLLDLTPLDDFFADLTGTAAARQPWFDLMIHNALTITAAGGYRPFGEIGAACLVPIAAAHGRTVTPEHRQAFGGLFQHLPAHPDVPDALARLRSAGSRVVTLTNSVAAVAEQQLTNAGLRQLVDAVYSADDAGRLKPAPEPYRHVLAEEGTPAEDAVLIAAHDWDVAGAAAAGLATAFVSRDGRAPLAAGPAPTVSGNGMAEVVDQLLGRGGADDA